MTFIKQPLVHFLLLGLLIFIAYDHLAGNDDEDLSQRSITVDRSNLLTFLQYRSKSFDLDKANQILDNLSAPQLQSLIDEYIREEVLHREAILLELDRDDYIIKRRMIQKLEYITQGFIDANEQLPDNYVQQFYDDNKSDYYIPPYVTFTHVFYSAEQRDWQQARSLAASQLLQLTENKVEFSQAPEFGERFLYNINYVERDQEFITSHFGKSFAQTVFSQSPHTEWFGPVKSDYGYHLVMISNKTDGRQPMLSEIQKKVFFDAQRAYLSEKKRIAINKIVDTYSVEVDIEQQATEQKPVQPKQSPETQAAS